ncbi:MAG: CoA ester lyase [Bacteroidota bacterium]|nr:CoA ester lyase [Bacteroidota bacterium]
MKNNLLRSLMFVPGHNEKLIESAANSDADVLLFDLEDSVQPPSNKPIARKLIIEKTKDQRFDHFTKFVRINEIETEFFLQDVLQLTNASINGFLLSKTNSRDDVLYLDNLLTSVEREKKLPIGKFKIIPILESTKSIVNIKEIAESSTRIVALGFGSEDYVSDLQGVRDFNVNSSIFNPRSYVPIVARAFGLEAIDAAYIKVHDLEGLEEHTQIGKTLGYSGMWVLHPKQNEIVNRTYSPTKEEYEEAKEFIRLYQEAEKLNKGVAIIEGKFIGPPVIVKANAIIKKVELIKEQNKNFY